MPHDTDLRHLARALELAVSARDAGDEPFGSLLVGPDGTVLHEAVNRVVTGRDVTAHPEIREAAWAERELDPATRRGTTMYASTEPCAMCAQAMAYAGLGRLVYSVGAAELTERFTAMGRHSASGIPSREVFRRAGAEVEVEGPLLLDDGLHVYGSWPGPASGS